MTAACSALCAVRFVQCQEDSHGSQIRTFASGAAAKAGSCPTAKARNTAPRWSPEGGQIVSQFAQSATQLRGLHDGRSLLVTAAVPVDCDRKDERLG